MCKKVRDLVYSDRRIQVEEIAQALGISHGSVSTILHDRLGMCKLTARWVPKSLSDEQMATRASVCSALLKRFRSKDDFLLCLVTEDETWVHYYEPVMANVFWDAKGVIMLDFLPKRSTIKKMVREKSRECHNYKPQPFPDTKRKRKPTNPNKHKSNKRAKSTKISSLFPKRGNRNTKRTEKQEQNDTW